MVVPHLFGEVICSLLFSYTIYVSYLCVLSELQTLEPILPDLQHCGVGGMKSAGHLCEPVSPLADFPLSQAKEMDCLVSPHLLSDDELKDSNGRVRAKDKGEQPSFSVTVQCLAQNVTENYNLPLLGSRLSWEYIQQLQSTRLNIFTGAEVTGWEVVLRLREMHSLCTKDNVEQIQMAEQVTYQLKCTKCMLRSKETNIIMLSVSKAAK